MILQARFISFSLPSVGWAVSPQRTLHLTHPWSASFILVPKPFSLEEQVPEDKLLKQVRFWGQCSHQPWRAFTQISILE